MTLRIKFYTLFLSTVLVLGCNSNTEQHFLGKKKLSYYKETPDFIKLYLDSVSKGKFRIAEPYQKWNSGCVISDTEPWCQFITTTLSTDQYQIRFRSGGLVVSDNLWTLNFKGKAVISFIKSDIK